MNRKEKLDVLLNELRRYDSKGYKTELEQDCLDTIKEGDYTLDDYIHCMRVYWIPDWISMLCEDEVEKKNDLLLLQNVLTTLE